MSESPWSWARSFGSAWGSPCSGGLIVFQPAIGFGDGVMTSENGIDFGHVGGVEFPAQSAEVFVDFFGTAGSDEAGADGRVAGGPAQRKLRQRLAVPRGDGFQVLDGCEVAREMIWAEHGAEQVQTAQSAAI